MKKLLHSILFIVSIQYNTIAETFQITYNSTTSITCSVGDILEFYVPTDGYYYINSNLGEIIPLTNATVNNLYLGQYTVAGGETDITFVQQIPMGMGNLPIINSQNIQITFNTTTGLFKNNSKHSLTIYPNPATDFLTIDVQKSTILLITDSKGHLVLKENAIIGINKLTIETLQPDIYFISTNDGRVSRFIKK